MMRNRRRAIRRSTLGAAAAASAFYPSTSLALSSPYGAGGSGALASAVLWIQGTLLGTVATVIAIIAVASVGFLMLMGRLNWRYGASVVLGCFILFGAPSIAVGIRSAIAGDDREWVAPVAAAPRPVQVVQPAPVAVPPPSNAADPFAGAAVPAR